jgi:D-glutamate cyclase
LTNPAEYASVDHIAFENIDRLLNVEMRSPVLPRGLKWRMYEMARERAGVSLVYAAAREFDRAPAQVLLVSGAAVPDFMPVGENDGPIGTVVLARALAAMGHRVRIVTDPVAAPPFRGLLRAVEVDAEVLELGLDDMRLQERLADECDVLCAIERLGGNVNGIIYGATGVSRAPHRANVDHMFDTARRAGKRTIGIGDGGNEIGFGNLHPQLSQALPEYTYKHVTPCGGGVFSVVETDALLVANSSNMGANAVTAGLALLRRDLSLCHTAELEYELAHVGVGLGLIDGGTGQLRAWCDGVPPRANAAVVEVLRTIVMQALTPKGQRKF